MIENSAEIRKKISLIYNGITQELFTVGTSQIKVDISNHQISIFAKHRKVPILAKLGVVNPAMREQVDHEITKIYKQALTEQMESEFGIRIQTIFRDFDPGSETALTHIILD
ncbi:Na-translocating system protein MpsC family protein [Paenibacillus filicis]|uniref:Na-translocating system protein MpsC family protein n=1 Tax=Paenibacillus filicis TaxID=669464 RepID=A0ABU9DFE8_9BACL